MAYRVDMADQPDMANAEKTDMDLEYTIPTNNSFNPLAGQSTSESTANKSTTTTGRTLRADKPGTCIIPMEAITKVANIKSLAGLYSIKRLAGGEIELFPAHLEAETKIKSELSLNGVEYFCHARNKVHKYVVYGLHRMDPNLIPAEINKESGGRYSVAAAKTMIIKNPKYAEQTNYLIYFNSDPTLPLLKDLKLFNTIVNWRHYEHKRTGPSRCTNCQMWGHGAFGCRRNPKCVACAGCH